VKIGRSEAGAIVWNTSITLTGMQMRNAALYEGHAVLDHHPETITPSAVTAQSGTRGRSVLLATKTSGVGGGLMFEVCANNSTPSKLVPHFQMPRYILDQPNQVGGESWFPGGQVNYAMRLNKHIYPPSWGGPGKFYVEATWVGFGFDGNNTYFPDFFVAPVEMQPIDYGQSGTIGTGTGCFGMSVKPGSPTAVNYVANGVFTQLALLTATAGSASMRVGLAIDYVNATVQVFFSTSNGYSTQSPLLSMVVSDAPFVLTATMRQTSSSDTWSVNTTGPFVSKPVGFSAWDWENEIP
jgi:hypothetical protein